MMMMMMMIMIIIIIVIKYNSSQSSFISQSSTLAETSPKRERFLCGLHKVCSHMTRSNIFICPRESSACHVV